MTPPRVAIVTTEPTASRVPQLDLLARRPDLDLTVFYAAETVQRRRWDLEIGHPHVVLSGPTIPTARVIHHDYPVTPSLWRRLDAGRFDVVVVWGWSTFAAQLAIVWARAHGVPFVLFSESHHSEPRRPVVRSVRDALLPRIVRPAAAWLVTGRLARDHLVHYGADPRRVFVFANTIDVDALEHEIDEQRRDRDALRSELGVQPEEVVVLHAGRLLPIKGPDLLVEAAAGVPGLHVLVVGDGPLRGALADRAAQLGVKTTFLGFLDHDGLARAYAAADVFALLSRRETWGVVVNEAAAAGLPLVLADTVGAAADLLVPGENGILVASGDVEATRAALRTLTADPSLRERYGARSRALIAGWGYGPSADAFVAAVESALGS